MGKDGDKSEMRYYNGVTDQEMNTAYGMKKLGIENVKPFFTRGHLFDVEAVKGAMMEAGQEITIADLKAALQKQNMQEADIKEGDARVLQHRLGQALDEEQRQVQRRRARASGWKPPSGSSTRASLSPAPIPGEPRSCPIPTRTSAFPVHAELITKNGIFNHENMDFPGLIADGKYQFAYIFSPAPIRGATGSNGGPIAVT